MKPRYWSCAAALLTLVAFAAWTLHALESAAAASPPAAEAAGATPAVMPQ